MNETVKRIDAVFFLGSIPSEHLRFDFLEIFLVWFAVASLSVGTIICV